MSWGKRLFMIVSNMVEKEQIKEKEPTVNLLKSNRFVLSTTIFTLIIIMLSSIYLFVEWNRYQNDFSGDAVDLAQSLKVLFNEDSVAKLSGSADDLEKTEYKSVKKDLMDLVEATDDIHYAYLLAEQEGNILMLSDSELPGSSRYSPPGQIFEKANEGYLESFGSGKTLITKPTTDRWGTWISVLVPVKEGKTESTIAVLGIDYSASEWYLKVRDHMIVDLVIVFFVLTLSFSLLFGWIQYKMNQTLSRKLSYSEVLYRNIFEQALVGIAIVNGENFTYQSEYGHSNINPMFERILGRTSVELMNVKWTDITHPDDLHANMEAYNEFKDGKNNGYTLEKRYIKPDGSVVWTNIKVSRIFGLGDNPTTHLTVAEDISERKQMEFALKESERKMAVLLSHLPGMAYRCKYDHDWTMQFVSEGTYNLTGYSPESLINNRELSFNDLISPEYREILWNRWEYVLEKRLPFKYEYEITTASGERKWVLEMGQGIYNSDGKVEALEGIILDISERKEIENNLRYIIEHDKLTGLYNRDYLEAILIRDAEKQAEQKRAVVGINLNTVQLLTANYGYHHTQNMIKSAADALTRHSNDKCMLFKTHENRFVFYIKGYKDKNELIGFCEAVMATLEELFVTDRIGGGIGICEIDQMVEMDVDMLLKRLLIATERATNIYNKDFSYCYYNDELEGIVMREAEIRQALAKVATSDDDSELYLEFQPIWDLKTDSVCSFEALARLKTEKLGQVSPSEFIPIAEETKLIIPTGEKVIIKALTFLNRLKESGFDEINVSVNVSIVQLLRPDFFDRVHEIIREMQANPENIAIEITESVFSLDYEGINTVINKLKDSGLRIAIDDFGTGYSSLARERELSINCLKIDKYFINKLKEDDPGKSITGDIISMAHRLGHNTVAEGVEYEEQKQYLEAHGCDKIQGHLISKPLSEDDAIEFLKKTIKKAKGSPEKCRLPRR